MDVFFNAFSMFITGDVTLKAHVEIFGSFFIKIRIYQLWHFKCWYSIETGKEEKNAS